MSDSLSVRTELVLNESHIQRMDIAGCEVSLVLAKAPIHHFNQRGEWLPQISDFKRARITLDEVIGRVPCEGLILDGHFKIGDKIFQNIPLDDFSYEGDIELQLVMSCGDFTFSCRKIRITLMAAT